MKRSKKSAYRKIQRREQRAYIYIPKLEQRTSKK